MRFELPDGYKVRYYHDDKPTLTLFERPVPDGDRCGLGWMAYRRRTRASIVDADGNLLAEGGATCRPDEPFCRRIGRDVARGRALKALAGVLR